MQSTSNYSPPSFSPGDGHEPLTLEAALQAANIVVVVPAYNEARKIASRLRAGQVSINGGQDMNAPFGGYKMSGNGREWGEYAFAEFLETKAVIGSAPKVAAE